MSNYQNVRCVDCKRFLGPDDGCRLCRFCAPVTKPRDPEKQRELNTCERCDRPTYQPLNDDGECGRCQSREPDPTPDEINRMCAEIRAERGDNWEMD